MYSLKPNYEQKLFKAGSELVAGVDEVGRGALAGPLIAAIVVFDKPSILRFARNVEWPIRDSKLLSAAQRIRLIPAIESCAQFIAHGKVTPQEIDQRGMGWASREVFYRAIKKCKMKSVKCKILVDAVKLPKLLLPHESIVHGDSKIFSIAVASIYAKVLRDRLMHQYAKKHPAYGFKHHVGYGTAEHFKAIEKYGLCPLHRKSFCPTP